MIQEEKELEMVVALLEGRNEEFLNEILAIPDGHGSCHWRQFATMWRSGACRDTGFLALSDAGFAALLISGVPVDTEVGRGIEGPNLGSQYGESWYIDDDCVVEGRAALQRQLAASHEVQHLSPQEVLDLVRQHIAA